MGSSGLGVRSLVWHSGIWAWHSSQAGHVGTALDILMHDGGLPSSLKFAQDFVLSLREYGFYNGAGLSAGTFVKRCVSLLANGSFFLRLALHQIACSKAGALHMIGMCCNSFCQPTLECTQRSVLSMLFF